MRIIRERLGRNDGGPKFYLERIVKLDRLYDRIVIRHRKPAKLITARKLKIDIRAVIGKDTMKIELKKIAIRELVKDYMGIHQGDGEATELWLHFQKVINWVETIFPTYRKEMKGLDWGRLYAKYGERKYNPAKHDREVAVLMADKEVQRHGGIYEFLLSDRTLFEKLNLRTFDPDDMRVAYEKQKGICPICKGKFAFEEMRGDHIKPWSKGGKTTPENLQMLCADCNVRTSDKF